VHQIKEKRTRMGVTQVQLAALAGMDPATLNRIEQGKANPNLKTIERLADALGVEVADFFPKAQDPLFEAVERRRRSKATEARRIAEEINVPANLDSGNVVDVMRDVVDAEQRRGEQMIKRGVESGERQSIYGSVLEEFEHRLEDLVGRTFFGGFMYSGLLSAVRRINALEAETAMLRGEVGAPEKVRGKWMQ
jgi:transcriptional regulator with XRE-family HTH domain